MFNKLEPKADELIFNVATQERNFCDSFVYEPVNIEEEKLGNLYMLGEIKDVSEDSFYVLNYIATLIKRNYYSRTQKQPLSALEEALKKTNEGIQELISQKKTEWLGKLHFVVGVLSQDTFYFTFCGNPRIFFVRHGEITDVGEKITAGIKEITPQKIFRSIASGKAEKEDKIFIFTSEILNSIPKEILKEVTESPVPAKKIRGLASSQKLIIINTGGILIISFADEGREEKEIISPPAFSALKKPSEILLRGPGKLSLFFTTFKKILKLFYLVLRLIFKTLIYLLEKILFYLKKLGQALIKKIRKLGFIQKFEAKVKELSQKPLIQRVKNIIYSFKKKRVLLPLLCALIAFAILGGIEHQKQETKQTEWKKILEEAKTRYKEGEIALIYGAQEKAVKSFSETESLILKLEESPYFKKERKELKESLQAKFQKLTNLEIIEKPETLATLGEFSIKFDIQEIAISPENLLFASDPRSPLFYKFDIAKKEGEFALAPIPEGGVLKTISVESPIKTIAFFAPPENIFFYLPAENKFSESKTISSPYEGYNFQDLTSYQNNLYFLDSGEGEIVKFNILNKDGDLSSGKIWLKRSTKKVAEAKSIACDGSLWILDSQNNILKYTNGYFTQSLKTLIALENPTKIFTSSHHPLLYILDPPKKRLTLLDKKGQIVKQYFSEKFDNLKDFWVSDGGNTIYLLNGNQIFVIRVEL